VAAGAYVERVGGGGGEGREGEGRNGDGAWTTTTTSLVCLFAYCLDMRHHCGIGTY